MASYNGQAVYAEGPGMILGRSLESLASGTGTIMVAVQPMWWAGDVLALSSPTTTASPSSPLIDSPFFTLRGSAWNAASSTAIESSFHLFNQITSVSSSLFIITNTDDTTLLTISEAGNTTILGDLSVGKRLFLGSASSDTFSTSTYLFVDDTQAPTSTYIATNADGWQTNSTYDYAERYVSQEELKPGDLVTIDSSKPNAVKRTTNPNDPILGIVSTKPGFITGAYTTGTYPIALAGRVPTRVSTVNGSIKAGDPVGATEMDGVGGKATNGPTIGIALEDFNQTNEGLIEVFILSSWEGQASLAGGAGSGAALRSGMAVIRAGDKEVAVDFPSIQAYPLITVTPYGASMPLWGLSSVTDHGFTILLAESVTSDVLFAWKAEPSVRGNTMSFSDHASVEYDAMYGSPLP
jgi:hypothetical protein